MISIESLLSARLFVAPQLVQGRIYFISNLSGRLSLYAMDKGGSVPEPLLPPQIALQNPQLMEGALFVVLPKLSKILVLIDQDGNEHYQPMLIPITGGFPEPAFGDSFANEKINLVQSYPEENLLYFWGQAKDKPVGTGYSANIATGEVKALWSSSYGAFPAGSSADHRQVLLMEAFGVGDHVLYLWEEGKELQLLYGVPLAQRQPDQVVPPSNIAGGFFIRNGQGILCYTSLFSDCYGLGYLALDRPQEVQPVTIMGEQHQGVGELQALDHLIENRYALTYNIDGCTWLYEGELDEQSLTMYLQRVIVGQAPLAGGVTKGNSYDKATGRHIVSFTTATSPAQIVTIEPEKICYHTREKVLGIPADWLSAGEDASFVSYDGLRISARLYMPASALSYTGPRPLIYYIHGGPQGQEHPDFAWFSMPLIQFLTLNGFAVFVPNVRGSTGYGFTYMNHVVRDWGGKDRLDHVHAMTQILPQDPRLDSKRAAVVGRSYGGYMTLTLSGRHPELWSAAVDMFGPYNLITFAERVPETWKPFIAYLVGDPVKEPEFLRERSPHTYIQQLQCPLLVVQGKNDPRVWEIESRELVEDLHKLGKQVDYLMFEDEGHDILKYENRVRCYNTITNFFSTHLHP